MLGSPCDVVVSRWRTTTTCRVEEGTRVEGHKQQLEQRASGKLVPVNIQAPLLATSGACRIDVSAIRGRPDKRASGR